MRKVAAVLVLCALGAAACSSDTSVKGLEPDYGNVAGGDQVLIVGSNFQPGMVVQFGRQEVKHVVIESPTRLRVKSPSGPEGKVDVILTRDDGKTFVLKNGFTYRRDAPVAR